MSSSSRILDPYGGCILTQGLGPIRSQVDWFRHMTELPQIPGEVCSAPKHIRLHFLARVRNFHLPSYVEPQLAESIDLMVRPSYERRNPLLSSTWAEISGETSRRKGPIIPYACIVVGPSGTGKTEASWRALSGYPEQVIHHDSFPRVEGPFQQVVWLSVQVPSSGKADDLVRALMRASDEATQGNRFAEWLERERIAKPYIALEEWLQWARAHFLGVLHLDEVQNFFKLMSLKQRKRRDEQSGSPELSIVEDKALLWLLTFVNSGASTAVVSGTPDGVEALNKRFSTISRLALNGHHAFMPFANATDEAFVSYFLRELSSYQVMSRKIEVNAALAEHIYSLTAGVQRLIVGLWAAAHRVALAGKGDELLPEHFTIASQTLLAPLQPAVAALLSRDVNRLTRYEDLVGADPTFWKRFWSTLPASG